MIIIDHMKPKPSLFDPGHVWGHLSPTITNQGLDFQVICPACRLTCTVSFNKENVTKYLHKMSTQDLKEHPELYWTCPCGGSILFPDGHIRA